MSSSEFPRHSMPRRQFIQLSALPAGGVLAGGFTLTAPAAATGDESKMTKNKPSQTPRFAYVGSRTRQGRKPRFMNLTPDGTRLFVANEESDTIVSFDVDQVSGALGANGQVIKTGSPVCMIFKTI
jgi:hypothetical protein